MPLSSRGPKDITVGERTDPAIQEPSDGVVRVVLACGIVGVPHHATPEASAAIDERRAIKSLIRLGSP